MSVEGPKKRNRIKHKSARLDIFIRPEYKETIVQAAGLLEMSVAEFVATTAHERACQEIVSRKGSTNG